MNEIKKVILLIVIAFIPLFANAQIDDFIVKEQNKRVTGTNYRGMKKYNAYDSYFQHWRETRIGVKLFQFDYDTKDQSDEWFIRVTIVNLLGNIPKDSRILFKSDRGEVLELPTDKDATKSDDTGSTFISYYLPDRYKYWFNDNNVVKIRIEHDCGYLDIQPPQINGFSSYMARTIKAIENKIRQYDDPLYDGL